MSDLPIGTIVFDDVSKRYRLGMLGTLRGTVAALTGRGRNGDGRRDLWALKEISFRVESGESLGLIGPNGAGKTTALKLLSNITQPTAGQIAVSGRTSSLIELGAGFHPELSGRDNIFLNGAILGLKRQEIHRKLDEIVAFSELERFIDTPVKRYSSGMYVRLGFAVAAHVEPDILLVDEVLAVGDASFRHRCMVRMQTLQEEGTTLLFVSHNMHMVRRMCKRALLLKDGLLGAHGATADVIAEYERSLVAGMEQPATGKGPTEDQEEGTYIRLSRITVLPTTSVTSAPGTPIQSDSPAIIRIEYQADASQAIGRVDVRIIRDDGTLCSAIDGHVAQGSTGCSLDELGEQGEIRITLEPIQLTTGRYSVLVRMTDPTDSAVIASGQSEYFQVFTRRGMTNPGIFVPRSQWRHDRFP